MRELQEKQHQLQLSAAATRETMMHEEHFGKDDLHGSGTNVASINTEQLVADPLMCGANQKMDQDLPTNHAGQEFQVMKSIVLNLWANPARFQRDVQEVVARFSAVVPAQEAQQSQQQRERSEYTTWRCDASGAIRKGQRGRCHDET